MGTASLVFGLILIGAGVVVAYDLLTTPNIAGDSEAGLGILLGFGILVAPLCALGGVLLRKYDKDKKKEKNS